MVRRVVLTDGDRSGAGDDDQLDGGQGDFDAVLYDRRTAPVAVDLAAGVAGEQGEHDAAVGFERASGGAAGDRITGTAGRDWLYGNGGSDVIAGRQGADNVFGGDGIDRMSGAGGRDELVGGPGTDVPRCGTGTDTVSATGRGERLGPDCEFVRVDPFDMRSQPLRVTPRAVWLDGRCPEGEDYGGFLPCRGTLELREATGRRRLLGRAPFSLKEARPVRVRLTEVGRRLVSRRRGALADVSYRAREASPGSDPFHGKADWAARIVRRR